ncbi:Uncharacterised protein [Mycobacteroides abscessus subsp. massiliense]|nr:Uncharacterised protein [Mycobacteroides abscessus subsp. massiliense]
MLSVCADYEFGVDGSTLCFQSDDSPFVGQDTVDATAGTDLSARTGDVLQENRVEGLAPNTKHYSDDTGVRPGGDAHVVTTQPHGPQWRRPRIHDVVEHTQTLQNCCATGREKVRRSLVRGESSLIEQAHREPLPRQLNGERGASASCANDRHVERIHRQPSTD